MSGPYYYEFRLFPDEGAESTQFHGCASDGAARAKAGRLAKRHEASVDVARFGADGREEWGKRYITTASPSPYHASGFRFERLEV